MECGMLSPCCKTMCNVTGLTCLTSSIIWANKRMIPFRPAWTTDSSIHMLESYMDMTIQLIPKQWKFLAVIDGVKLFRESVFMNPPFVMKVSEKMPWRSALLVDETKGWICCPLLVSPFREIQESGGWCLTLSNFKVLVSDVLSSYFGFIGLFCSTLVFTS